MSYTKNGFLATGVGGTTNGLAVATKYRPTSAGDVTISSTSYVDVDTTLDMTIPAKAGDYIGLGVDFIVTTASTGAATFFDFVTLVNGSTVSYASGNGAGGDGIIAWRVQYAPSGNNVNWPLGPEFIYQIASGDVSGGYVTFRFKTKMSSGTSVISLGTTRNLGVYAKNLSTPASAGNVYGSPSINKPQGTQLRQYTFDNDIQNWTANGGTLTQVGGTAQLTHTTGNTYARAYEPASAASVSDGEMYLDLIPVTLDPGGLLNFKVFFRYTDDNNHYEFTIQRGAYNAAGTAQLVLAKYVAGASTTLASSPTTSGASVNNQPLVTRTGDLSPIRVFIRFVGSRIWIYVNETLLISVTDTSLTSGRVAVGDYMDGTGTSSVFQFDNVTVYSLPSTWNPAVYTPQSAAAAPQYQIPTLGQVNYAEVNASVATITNQQWSVLPFDTIVSDPNGLWSTSNKWYTVPVTGTYAITMKTRIDAASSTNVGFAVFTSNIDSTATVWRQDSAGGGGRHTFNLSSVGKYNAGDQLRAIAYVDTPGSTATGGGTITIQQVASAAPVATQPQQSWQAPSLLNSWTNYGSDGGGSYSTAAYFLNTDGNVQLKGLLKAPSGLTSGSQLFILPVGYRPVENMILPVAAISAATGVRLNIYGSAAPTTSAGPNNSAPGSVNLFFTGTLSANDIASIDAITFRQFG